MANKAEHAVFNGVAGAAAVLLVRGPGDSDRTAHACLIGVAAACLPSLPDAIEPPTSPNHRASFHGWAALGLTGYVTWRAYEWQPTEPVLKGLRLAAIVAGIAYTAHLVRDSFSARSLPLV